MHPRHPQSEPRSSYSYSRHMAAAVLFVTCLFPFVSHAQGLGYNHVEAGFARLDPDSGVDADGVFVRGSWLLGRNVFITASFSDTDTDYFPDTPVWAEYETFGAGLGYRVGLAQATDWVTQASYLRSKVSWRTYWQRLASESDDGYGLSTGIRHLWSERVELAAGVSYTEILGGDETSFNASLMYHLNPTVGFLGGVSYSDDGYGLSAGLRLKF